MRCAWLGGGRGRTSRSTRPRFRDGDLLLCARVSLLLRGMSQLMAQRRLSTATLWRTEAERALRTLEVEG